MLQDIKFQVEPFNFSTNTEILFFNQSQFKNKEKLVLLILTMKKSFIEIHKI